MTFHFKTPGTPGLGAYLGQALGKGAESFGEQFSKIMEERTKMARQQKFAEAMDKYYDEQIAGIEGREAAPPTAAIAPGTVAEEFGEETISAQGDRPPEEIIKEERITEKAPAKKPVPPLPPGDIIRMRSPEVREAAAERRELRKEGRVYSKEGIEKGDKALNSLNALNTQLAAVKAGEVGPMSWGNFAEWSKIEAFHTPGSAAFKSATKQLFSGIMDVFGKRILAAEIPIWEGQMAKIGRTKAPNELVIKAGMIQPKIAWKKRNLIQKFKTQGMDADKIEMAVSRQLDPYVDQLYKEWHNDLEKAVGKKIGGPNIASTEEGISQLEMGSQSKVRMYDKEGQAFDIPANLADEYEKKHQLRRKQ